MFIKELKTGDSSTPQATITLDYAEIRDIANGLYSIQDTCGKETLEIYNQMQLLFSLVKTGTFGRDSIKHAAERFEKIVKARNNEQ